MDNPALTQRVKALLICGLGLAFATFLGTQIGAENYAELLLGTVIVAVASVSLFSGRFFWVLTIASSFLGGTFPILGGQFTPFQILMAIGVAKFFVGDVVLRRTRLKTGNRVDALLILGFMAILTWHGVHDRFGMRFLGSNVWGGRNYVNVYVGLAAFAVIQSIPMNPKHWAKLPYVILVVTAFDATIAVITSVYPGSIYKIYPFYSAVSIGGIEEVLTGSRMGAERIGAFGNFGFILVLIVLATVSIRQILHPANLHRLVVLAGGCLAVLYSGFRTGVLNTLIAGVIAGIRDLKWVVLAMLPFIAVILFGLSIVNSDFIALPKQIQRGLTFLPGKWDVDMANDAAASNYFRQAVWTIWGREYFPRQPLLGRGFGFRSDWAKVSVVNQSAYETQQMVETGNIHNGLFSTVDALGLVGTIFFVIWNLRLLRLSFHLPTIRAHPEQMTVRFLGLYLATSILFYWVGAPGIGTFLPKEFAVAAVFLRLQREIASPSSRDESLAQAGEPNLHEELATA